MKILRKIIVLILFMLIIFALTSAAQLNNFNSLSIAVNNRKISNVAVIFHTLDDPYMMKLKESLEAVEKENKNNVKFTFFDAKNNIAIQNEILDSALKSNFSLFILNSVDKNENAIKDIIYKVKEKNIPSILMNLSPEIVSKVSKIYDKAVFVEPDSKQSGMAQGKIIVDLWNKNRNIMDKNGDDILQYVFLQGASNDSQAIDRTKYAISTINNLGVKTQQLELIHANWLKELAQISVDNLFFKYNGNIEAIISNNDIMAIGAIEVLQKYGFNKGEKSKYIAVFGIDGLQEAKELVDKGIMTGTIIQDPNVAAKMFYTIGMNLINNLNPTENTNYKIINGKVIIPYPYEPYLGNLNNL